MRGDHGRVRCTCTQTCFTNGLLCPTAFNIATTDIGKSVANWFSQMYGHDAGHCRPCTTIPSDMEMPLELTRHAHFLCQPRDLSDLTKIKRTVLPFVCQYIVQYNFYELSDMHFWQVSSQAHVL